MARRDDADAQIHDMIDHLGLRYSRHLSSLLLERCSALCDAHLDALSLALPSLRAISIDACHEIRHAAGVAAVVVWGGSGVGVRDASE